MTPEDLPRAKHGRPRPIVIDGECWIWTASRDRDGYGYLGIGARTAKAHRWAYETLVGPIPEGHHLDHLCRNRACINPKHLEPVTPWENAQRGVGVITVQHLAQTHCKHGHEFTPENTYIERTKRGTGRARSCRACNRRAVREYNARRQQVAS